MGPANNGMKVEDELDRAIERYFDSIQSTTFGNRFTITKYNGKGEPSDTRALAHTWLRNVINAVKEQMWNEVDGEVDSLLEVPDPDFHFDCKLGKWVKNAQEVEGDCGY